MAGGNKQNIGGLEAKRRRRTWIVVTSALVVVVVAIAAVVLTLKPWTEEFRHGGLTVAAPPSPVKALPQVSPAPATAPAPSRTGLAAALAGVAANPDLGVFAASVSDGVTGEVLWSIDPDKPQIPASNAKVVLTAAALLALPPDRRVTTKVVTGAAPGELVLVGGGDPTLTNEPDGKGYYPDGPKLSDLVAQIKNSGRPVDSIVVDTSLYTGSNMAQGWDPRDIAGGSIAPIEPVMIDGGRLQPLVEYSPRTETPALDAGKALAAALGIDPARVRAGTAPAGAQQVAAVQSAQLKDRLRDMMVHSDDVLAETIAREIAQATGNELSFAGAVTGMMTTLRAAGFDLTGATLLDGSGLSVDDLLPPRLLDHLVAVAALPNTTAGQGDSPAPDPLASLLDYLPVAGATGTLGNRYTVRDRDGAGWVRAKTGTLDVASSLVGYVLDRDGRVLTFALMSNQRLPEASRPALDAIAATLRNCGCS
ncbi:D-alanyl-D-alanine carboxypeptidase/D-alanyl-D-alanine-endopeptidase [Nocardia huaxiensis]|uniref:D-alanyl-D-alanine carboxypeptidase/D-alanyl-D-alanine-endopeptidase n=1 Tax=Nocardia huaxiensis TaxID=2755382 RepID=A0A7D6ZHY0_9NOCA|nr:D-alanyl-D-alanine carboxypeptidase/D-alanyl-D-alanine-endopeptidase [Nocardia huaxiensis]QLY31399.1 D-alanyl-D-alanine carboxypeptidase/D-alanyl-D-alanine-endopeptidase [Nocardia huaxiensis]UFS94946.1 D-alanyl-D-alanine carboxypeptidase/D-alanyl-D-alanine-endopeptidase [Nocardia huaxiensis]